MTQLFSQHPMTKVNRIEKQLMEIHDVMRNEFVTQANAGLITQDEAHDRIKLFKKFFASAVQMMRSTAMQEYIGIREPDEEVERIVDRIRDLGIQI